MNFELVGKHYIEVIVPSNEFTKGSLCGNIDLLYPPFKAGVVDLLESYKQYNKDNDVPYILESYRSHALQNAYFYRGASKIRGGSILNAGMHHFGIAVDVVNLKDRNGNNTKDLNESVDWTELDYTLLRKLANSIGLVVLSWELCHFQGVQTGEQSLLRRAVFDYVVDWQQEYGLVPDGIVGPKTIAKAQSLYL